MNLARHKCCFITSDTGYEQMRRTAVDVLSFQRCILHRNTSGILGLRTFRIGTFKILGKKQVNNRIGVEYTRGSG